MTAGLYVIAQLSPTGVLHYGSRRGDYIFLQCGRSARLDDVSVDFAQTVAEVRAGATCRKCLG